jgi:uncharacterized repeat protein (TIGR04042 family)
MPAIHFQIEWPDGFQETCYSPSLIVKEYLTPQEYSLEDFLHRSRTALQIASDRVKAKYGFPCGLALGQLDELETRATQYQELPQPKVRVVRFME